jgi:hypothetical protein
MNNQFENDLNSEKNLKLTLKLVKELNLIKGVSINKRIIDIAPEIINTKSFFGLINSISTTDHIHYDLYFDGKNITITKTISWDDSWGGDYSTQTIVQIKLKILKSLEK